MPSRQPRSFGTLGVSLWLLRSDGRRFGLIALCSCARTGEDDMQTQDFGEFVEDRFVEMYGMKKMAVRTQGLEPWTSAVLRLVQRSSACLGSTSI